MSSCISLVMPHHIDPETLITDYYQPVMLSDKT